MSKSVLGIGLAIVGVALMATGIGAPLGMAIGSIGLSWATVIGTGLLIASSALLGPSMPKMPGSLADGGRDRLFASLDPTSPRKFAFGTTALATDVRYQTFTGTDQEYIEQIVCVASHEVQAIDEIWLDNEKAWTSAGGAQGRYVGYLTVATRLVGTSSNGIGINSVWTTTATLTGCAYAHLKYKLTGNSKKAESPFSGGVTNRMTIRGKGAKVYDPRLDSTVAGGAGTHRANDQTTWAWSADASRNPALQLLWYELGWKIGAGTKPAVGKGVPPARLDLASYAVAANACDEAVTLAVGGTEPRYRSDGVMSEGDDPSAVREALCATMNAVLRDSGGQLALTVLVNDLAAPVASFGENDVIGGVDWQQTPQLHNIFNIVRGRRIDPSDATLYQPVDFAEVKLTSPDGIDRIDSVDFPLVQSNGQAQRLAKQRLQRNQYQGRLQLIGKPSWWQLSLGEVFEFTHPSFGWTNKLFRCAGIKISRTGETEIVAVEENAAIYAWDEEEAPAVTPGAPTIYDPLNNPLVSGIDNAALVIDGAKNITIEANHEGTILSGQLPKTSTYVARDGTGIVSPTWVRTIVAGTITCTISTSGQLSITAFTGTSAKVQIDATFNGITQIFTVDISRHDALPPEGGGGGAGGTTSSDTTIAATTSNTFAAISDELSVTVSSGGKVKLTAPLAVSVAPQSPPQDWPVEHRWQHWTGAAWADLDTGATASNPHPTTVLINDGTFSNFEAYAGSVSTTFTHTGRTPTATEKYRLTGRNITNSTTITRSYSGTAKADGTVV